MSDEQVEVEEELADELTEEEAEGILDELDAIEEDRLERQTDEGAQRAPSWRRTGAGAHRRGVARARQPTRP